VKAYSNPRKPKGSISDPDAQWGVKELEFNTRKRVFGYKLQTSCDADFSLPLDYQVVPAKTSDMRLFHSTLVRTKMAGNSVDVAIADKGYDSKQNNLLCIKHHSIPIIAYNRPRSKDRQGRRADYILPVKRNSAEWNRYYRMRVSIERMFARLKQELGLEHLKLRRLERVEVHFAICLIAMIAIASTASATGFSQLALCVEPWRYYG
jgi:transposase